MLDIRSFLLKTTENFYNRENLIIDDKSEISLSEFVCNPVQLHLQSVIINDNTVAFRTQIKCSRIKSLIFYKTSTQELIEEDAARHLNIITLSDAPAESLYHILKQIYSPLLTAENDLVSSQLQQNIADLESNLRIHTHDMKDLQSINVILSVSDEIDYWKNVAQKKNATKKEREAATAFSELLEDINEEIRTMQTNSAQEMRDAAENIGGILDDIWRLTAFPYTQDRMKHMMDVIGHTICSIIQKTVSNTDIWRVQGGTKDNQVLMTLAECLKVIQTWSDASQTLTGTYWPNYALHPWSGKPYLSKFSLAFQNRLKEVHDVRSTHNQLNKLLSNSERVELRTEEMFEPFQNINIWICSGPNKEWDSAVAQFSSNLRPAEANIAEKLKPRLHNTSTKQMLYEFMRYKTLIDRPVVKRLLNNELEIFVLSLDSMLKGIRMQLDSEGTADVKMYRPPEMSATVQQVQWAKQMEAKVSDIKTCAEKHLNVFEGSNQLVTLSTEILKELKNMYTQLHEDWSRDLQVQVKSGALQLSLDKPVVEFSASNKMMVVQFNPRTVSAASEARSMAALGLPPPPAVSLAIDSLLGLVHHARQLQQVASFHNTMGERMIPSTRPMMLQAALELAALVRDQQAVYWDNEEQLANYADKLKKAVLTLEIQNSYLTSQHVAIRNIVAKLIGTELLAKQSEWKKHVKEIRDVIEKVEANGYKNTDLWRTHWDWQLYKALECQYTKTLHSLHKHFPNVKVDLVLRGRMVRVQPPIEEIRVQHYNQLRRFISLPAQFVGLQNSMKEGDSIFAAIVEKHSWMGNKSVAQIEATLSSVERACVEWTRRAALACVPDLEALCREHLKQPHDWEINFKACKAYGQAVAKMTFEDEKIDWISIGTATLRREFEAQVRNLWACLITSLQGSCRDDAAILDSFIANATVTLENKMLPKNAKELADISAKQHALKEKMPEMEKTVEDLKKKGHMLRTWGGDPSVDGTIKEWQKIHEMMLSQEQMFEHQAEIVKSSLNGDWENLNTGLEAWLSRWSQHRLRFEDTHAVTYEEMMDRCRMVFDARAQWEKFVSDRDELLKECTKFNMTPSVADTWTQAENVMSEEVKLWNTLKEYDEEYQSLAEQEWIVFQKKLHLIDELVSKWTMKLEPYTTVTLFLQQELDKYTDLTPLLKYLRGNELTERHWREVFALLEMPHQKPDALLLRDLLAVAANIKKHIKALQKISASASSESAIRSALNELELWFAGARLHLTYYSDKAQQPTPVVKDFKEILGKIEEQQWVVSSVRGSGESAGGAGGAGADACAAWDSRLRAAHALVRTTHHAQRRWLYLEPILSSDEGELGARFRRVDQGFRQVARIIENDPRLSALLQSSRLQPMLDSITEQLLACQSALNQYIDDKRATFPRLYFLSDDDLLELLGQARTGAEGREAVMQTHLKKLFPGITGVRLGPDGLSVTALCTHYGETLQLEHPVDIDCPVEVWLKNLESEMRSSIKNMTLKCVVTTSLQEQDPFTLPTQILCLAQNIRFTEQAEKAIVSKELHKLKTNVEKENLYYVEFEVEDENERNKRQALILQCAYYLGVIKTLITSNVVSTSHWLWQKQLRFYLLNTKEIVAKMGLATISYSYEYLGVNTGQFVRTELADECFLILTQALHLGLVGNPFGPAGTGKTESVKALGGLVGRLVLVFNCDEAMDAKCMGRLLSGLALCGAWGCFDEFNRLTADTLAAVSHQFASLLAAMTRNKDSTNQTALLNGKQVSVSPWCGIAATMNPAGRGYGGRRALPAALESILRPVAMTTPRGDELAMHLLAARAVPAADKLARDLARVFSLASELLSGQRHYDWGLRALKAAVGSSGAALTCAGAPYELNAQRAILRRVLRLNNLSKLTNDDAERFEAILAMVFSDVPEEISSENSISSSLEATALSLGLVYNKLQGQKCMELFEQMQQRMGVVMVGPPGSGKSTIRQLLKTVLTKQGKTIVEYVISPKAMSRNCLLGHIDHDTRQWTDGVISATALEISNQTPDVWSWVVCDGDIDPEWIEALNSVLDDNRLLTLPSGWRIQFGQNVNFIFETHSLEHASPATVSRMGIILLSDENSCAQEMLSSWLEKAEIENEMAKMAIPLLQKVINKCLIWFSAHKSDVITEVYNISMVRQVLTQFEYIAQKVGVSVMNSSPEELVYMAVQRSVIALLKHSAVSGFHEEMSELLGVPPILAHWVGEWRDSTYLSSRMASVEPAVRAVVTSSDAHLLIIGSAASGKNLLAEHILRDSSTTMLITINCTPILEPSDIIAELKRHNVVSTGGRGSARGARGCGARATLLVRSLHRARVDQWGSSLIHAILLQIIQQGGFWEQSGSAEGGSGVQWCGLQRMRVVATVDAPPLCRRLTAAFCVVPLPEPDDEEMLALAGHYLKQSVDKNIQANDLTDTTRNILKLYKEVTEWFYSQPHYKWTASDVRKWCENVKWYSPSNAAELTVAVCAEANNIFRDRLVTDSEKAKFASLLKDYFKDNVEGVYFAPKLRGSGVYMEAIEHRDWYQITQNIINQCLSEHEHSVFGDSGAEVCSELALLCPAMARATNGGVVVCVASAGLGRRAAAHVVATALPATLLFVNQTTEFNTQFKNALTSSGSESNRTLIVVSETAANKASLGAIEALLNARSIHAVPRDMMPSLSHTQPTQQFLDNVKQNLGIIVTLDKAQDNIFDLIEKYPILYRDSHLLWLERWSNETLRQMPQLIIQRMIKDNITEGSSNEHESIPVEGFVKIYNSMESECMRAPCRYVGFVKAYYHIVKKKKESLVQRRDMLSSGVEALRRARSSVASLQAEAAQQEAALSDKQASANHALDQIGATVRAATDRKEHMHALKHTIEQENDKLQIRKNEIEVELASVEPIIAAARAAVGDIRPESLTEIRSLRAPPDVVRDVLEGVLRLMGIADTSWHSMKSFLSKRGVKEDIRCMDASQISPEAAASVQKLLERRGSSFDDKVSRRASAACAPLAAWVRANVAYANALLKVRPLQLQQRQLMQNLQDAEEQLTALSSGLQTVDERVAALKQQLGAHTRDAAAIELRLSNAAQTLGAAKGLLEQLAHEYQAWESDLEYISKEISELNMRSLLAAAYIVYLPDATEPQARTYIKRWSELIGFEDATFSVINFLSTTEKQLKWDADGLPLDKSAIKNAVLIDQILEPKKCGFTPLIIDPDGDAMGWLKNTLAGFNCDFISQQNDKLHTAIQYAVRLGRVVVITDVDAAHASWSPLLRALPPGAGLLLYCRDATLPRRLAPHHAAALSLLHFTARVDGLTDQLVHYALQQQNPEVNEKSREIKLKKATLQKQQHELQENLLKVLSANGDILHDAHLLASLKETRSSSATIAEALQVARAVERETRTACDAFEPSAKRTAILALAVKELTGHRPLVALPVEAVLEVFVDGIRRGGDNEEIVKYVTRRIIERVLLALHKKDKYIIVMHLLKQVYENIIPETLWQAFVGHSDYIDDHETITEVKQTYPWIQNDCVRKVATLLATCPDFFNKLKLNNTDLWQEFQQSGDLSVIKQLNLSAFETVAAVAALRPESLYRAIVGFVDHVLGVGVMCRGGEVEGGGAVGTARRPLLLLGAHAHAQLAAVAAARAVALAQTWIDEGLEAWEAAVQQSRGGGGGGGGWLAIIVGASPFNAQLTTFVAHFAQRPAEEFCAEFRLWIISEDRDIPPLISNACVNIVLEAPEGVRNNVLSTLAAWGGYTSDEPKAVRMLACLAFLHAVLQARRAYIPEGWSQWYPFEWGDVSACASVIRASGAGAAACGLVAALYGGRVAAPPDRQLLAALLRDCLGEHTCGHAWAPRGTRLRLPFAKQLQVYASAFSEIPNIDSAEMLGLPANCRVAWETKAADNIVAGLKELNTAAIVKTVDTNPLKPILALWKKLMSGSPLIKGEYQNEKTRGLGGWWGCVCAGELREATRLVRLLHATLAALARQRAAADTRAALHKVPEEWQVLWAGPPAPADYIRELCYRARAALKRIDHHNGDNDYFPTELELRSFLQPRRALAAARARSADALSCAPDSLALLATWNCDGADVKQAAPGSVVVAGLRLCGARWDAALAPVTSRDAPAHPAPPILLRFLQQEESSSESIAQIPVYSSSAREALVASVPAPLAAPLDAAAAKLHAIALCVASV